MFCKECKCCFDPKDYRQKFCCRSCAASFNNRKRILSEKTKDKIHKALIERRRNKPKTCKYCGKEFYYDKPRRKYCSVVCFNKANGRINLNKISNRTARKILKRAFPNWKCPFCSWTKTFDVHHIIPRSKGGKGDLNNLVMLCPNHHSIAGKISVETLKKFSIGNQISKEELFNKYYMGNVPARSL